MLRLSVGLYDDKMVIFLIGDVSRYSKSGQTEADRVAAMRQSRHHAIMAVTAGSVFIHRLYRGDEVRWQ